METPVHVIVYLQVPTATGGSSLATYGNTYPSTADADAALDQWKLEGVVDYVDAGGARFQFPYERVFFILRPAVVKPS